MTLPWLRLVGMFGAGATAAEGGTKATSVTSAFGYALVTLFLAGGSMLIRRFSPRGDSGSVPMSAFEAVNERLNAMSVELAEANNKVRELELQVATLTARIPAPRRRKPAS